MDDEMDDIIDESLGMQELDDIFDDLIDQRFPVEDSRFRREIFMNYVHSFSNVYNILHISYPDGINSSLSISYFLLYSFLCMLNRHRGGFMDDSLIRQNVILILNRCAVNQFDLLYELIFDY